MLKRLELRNDKVRKKLNEAIKDSETKDGKKYFLDEKGKIDDFKFWYIKKNDFPFFLNFKKRSSIRNILHFHLVVWKDIF